MFQTSKLGTVAQKKNLTFLEIRHSKLYPQGPNSFHTFFARPWRSLADFDLKNEWVVYLVCTRYDAFPLGYCI